jgi:hypothetical protein
MKNVSYTELSRKYLGAPMTGATLRAIDFDIEEVTDRLSRGVASESRRSVEDALFGLFELRILLERAMGKYSGLEPEDATILRRQGYLSAGDT